MSSDCELIDLEDLRGHKGFQWFLTRAAKEWGGEAVLSRIEAVQNRLDIDPETRKEQVNQILVSRRSIMALLSEIDREISKRREALQSAPDELAGQRRRGETL